MQEIKISIIIATYNSAKTLRRCLDSIIPQLGTDCEVIVIDGGSKDETMSIVSSYGDKIAYSVSEPDNGVYDAWNKGVKASRGQFVMFIGSDDEMISSAIQKYRDFISHNGDDFDLICGKLFFVDKSGRVLRKVGEPWDWEKHCKRKLGFAHPGMLHNKRLFERIGYFDLQYKICADSDFLQRVGPDAKGGFIDEYLVKMSQGGVSDGYKAMVEGYLSRRNNKCIPVWYNVYQHFFMLVRYYGGLMLRYLKIK